MNFAFVAVALAVGAGAVIAVSSRDLRGALNGLALVVVGSTLLVDPLPSPATLGVRIVGGLLAVAILRVLLLEARPDVDSGSRFGWPAESLIACAAALGGVGIAVALAATPNGGIEAAAPTAAALTARILSTATAMGIIAVGATPAALGGSGAQRAIGLLLIVQAAITLRTGLAGPPGDFEQLAVVGLLLGTAATGAALARAGDPSAQSLDEAG